MSPLSLDYRRRVGKQTVIADNFRSLILNRLEDGTGAEKETYFAELCQKPTVYASIHFLPTDLPNYIGHSRLSCFVIIFRT